MNLEILISTMHRTSLDFLETMFPYDNLEKLSILIINQTKEGLDLNSKFNNIRVINSYERGLSKSRNLAIDNAFGDICLIADDDTEYIAGFQKIVKEAFENCTDASLIKFKIETFVGKPYKVYPQKSKRLISYSDINTISSVEIAFRRQIIVDKRIRFNELFGLGSVFKSGEEFLFLKEILDNNLGIYFKNESIVKHKFESSTIVGSDDYLKSQSILYFICYGWFANLYILKLLVFLVRKNVILKSKFFSKYTMAKKAIMYYKELRDA